MMEPPANLVSSVTSPTTCPTILFQCTQHVRGPKFIDVARGAPDAVQEKLFIVALTEVPWSLMLPFMFNQFHSQSEWCLTNLPPLVVQKTARLP